MNIKKELLRIKDYRTYAYTDEYKALNKAILTSVENYINTKEATKPIANNNFIDAFLPIAWKCFCDEMYASWQNLSNTKKKDILSDAVKYAYKRTFKVDKSTLRLAQKDYIKVEYINLNDVVFQVAVGLASDIISVDNKNYTPKTK